ncbi:MAG: hypothetical protein A3D38_00080 [Candidatus Portnoybacteria bacterium RIFCSPHIGHO2_02_FULL_40_23]|uniref:Cell division protein FtsL n=1 Tax=Candidatus Portnoybacteria bacterium RIFCSPHIGHO2_12_FULL_40_11 TaxID=1801998 RepID=A0A1G2FKI3_9BACT|nr:MAG: hypothetical protein A3D38_00080 [Candidatus Portnoybacteria bacterium RIFCSPHIGHO2_02_FULL_40_23]OGZ38599.1 MAG: hypothetical protein A3E90_01445 [Candidatus Portnoybacteria bacterium RIFCSPHIGHO2_12_FULL_40_11]
MTYIKPQQINRRKSNRGTAILSLLIIVSLFITGSIYLLQTNGVVSETYKLREEKNHLKELRAESQTLQIQAANLQSPANLETIAKELGMTESGKIIYLKEEGTMAMKK